MKDLKKIVLITAFLAFIVFFGAGTLMKSGADLSMLALKGLNKANVESMRAKLNEDFLLRNEWVNANGAFYRMTGSTYVPDPSTNVYKLDDGSIIYNMDMLDMTGYAESVAKLGRYLEKTGNGKLLYCQLPYKIEAASDLPSGMKDYGNINADAMLSKLKASGVEVMDIREEAKNEGRKNSEMFFKTDQHWKPDTAMWAAGKIARKLKVMYDPELYNIQNYNVKTYKDWFLGSLGKRTGKYYAGVDDFDLITPKEETSFKFTALSASGKISREGSFNETLIKKAYLKKRDLFNENCYAAYIGGDYKINKAVNLGEGKRGKVLLLRDSFSCALEPFLAMQYREVVAIDLRYYGKSLKKHLDKKKYDAVLICFNPSSFQDDQFRFGFRK